MKPNNALINFDKYYNSSKIKLPIEITNEILLYLIDINKIISLIVNNNNCYNLLSFFLYNGFKIERKEFKQLVLYTCINNNINLSRLILNYHKQNIILYLCKKTLSLLENSKSEEISRFILYFSKLHNTNFCINCYNITTNLIIGCIICPCETFYNTDIQPSYKNLLKACEFDKIDHIEIFINKYKIKYSKKCLQVAFFNNSINTKALLINKYKLYPTIDLLELACGYHKILKFSDIEYKHYSIFSKYNLVITLITKYNLQPNSMCLTNACYSRSSNIVKLLLNYNSHIITPEHISWCKKHNLSDILYILQRSV
jgi:hypothetical protein